MFYKLAARKDVLQWGRDQLIAEMAVFLSYSIFKHLQHYFRAPIQIQPPRTTNWRFLSS
jgi:hypothetical protein